MFMRFPSCYWNLSLATHHSEVNTPEIRMVEREVCLVLEASNQGRGRWWWLFTFLVVSNSLWPCGCSTPGFPVPHHLSEFAQVCPSSYYKNLFSLFWSLLTWDQGVNTVVWGSFSGLKIHCIFKWQKGQAGSPQASFIRALFPFTRAPTSWPKHFPKT